MTISTEKWAFIGKFFSALLLIIGASSGVVELLKYMEGRKKAFEFEVDAKKHASLVGWVDTKIDLSLQKRYSLKAAGGIAISQNVVGVDANGYRGNEFGSECYPFHCGELVARLGETGETIAVGTQKILTDLTGRLYLAVWDTNSLNNNGNFSVKIVVGE